VGGIKKSGFSFDSYKIDKVELHTAPHVGMLRFQDRIPNDAWELDLTIRQPVFYRHQNEYIGGMDIRLKLAQDDGEGAEPFLLIELTAGIAGIFSVGEEGLPPGVEETLVKLQIPTILFPYLRGTVTSLMANAGLGVFIFPLINLHKVAEEGFQDMDIKIIEDEPNDSPSSSIG